MTVRGDDHLLTATFLANGDLVDPGGTITLTVTLNAAPVFVQTYPGSIVRQSEGLYAYNWHVPLDAGLGVYVADWQAVLPGSPDPVHGYDTFTVEAEGTVISTGARYCTLAEARAAGAVGDDAAVLAAIDQAMERVDRFTHDRFSPRVMTVQARIGGDGRALLPFRLTSAASVIEVRNPVTGSVLDDSVWVASSSSVPGAVDGIGLGRAWVGTNILVYGLEPWAQWRPDYDRVEVDGTFGYATTPTTVAWATARLAASIARSLLPDPDNNPATPPPTTGQIVDPEGNVLPVVPPFVDLSAEDDAAADSTTGDRKVDAVLMTYRQTPMLAGV